MNNNYSVFETFRFSILIRLTGILVGVITFFGIMIHLLEPTTFPTFFDGIWWAVVTVFTIGYGDYVPESFKGKITAICLILLGTAFGSYYMITFVTGLINKQYANQKGEAIVSLHNHLIIVGWNERMKHIVQQYKVLYPHKDIVLIDESLPGLPADYSQLLFVKGCPHHDDVMQRAGIKHADAILITADKEKNEVDADTHSILTILTIKGLNPALHCIVEILTPHQVTNAKRAGANEIVQANQLTSYVLTASMLFPSAPDIINELCNQATTNKIQIITTENSQIGQSFRQCSQSLLEKDILLLGIQREGQHYIHPVHPFSIKKDDTFIVIRR